mmetsp:Transcript_8286/g.9389  ORF Transcript_8286/g.9389 Transcript_8286/m.9389 type:complete len:192 (-) Transcript_8286:41-616(-)
MRIAEENQAGILVLGYHGRKGPKTDPTLLGSNVDLIAHEPFCPVLIIKRAEFRKDKVNNAYRFLVCMDEREKSVDALDTVIKIMDTEVDEVIVVTVAARGHNTEKISTKASKICEDSGVKNFKYEMIEREHAEQYQEALLDYINVDDTPYIDFVAIANRGVKHHTLTEDKHLGKVAKQVLYKSQANVLLIC